MDLFFKIWDSFGAMRELHTGKYCEVLLRKRKVTRWMWMLECLLPLRAMCYLRCLLEFRNEATRTTKEYPDTFHIYHAGTQNLGVNAVFQGGGF